VGGGQGQQRCPWWWGSCTSPTVGNRGAGTTRCQRALTRYNETRCGQPELHASPERTCRRVPGSGSARSSRQLPAARSDGQRPLPPPICPALQLAWVLGAGACCSASLLPARQTSPLDWRADGRRPLFPPGCGWPAIPTRDHPVVPGPKRRPPCPAHPAHDTARPGNPPPQPHQPVPHPGRHRTDTVTIPPPRRDCRPDAEATSPQEQTMTSDPNGPGDPDGRQGAEASGKRVPPWKRSTRDLSRPS